MSVVGPGFDLRQAVRDIIREVLADRSKAAPQEPESVRIVDDDDLARFVASLLNRLDNPEFAHRLRNGHHRFSLENRHIGNGPIAKEKVLATRTAPALEGVVTQARLMSLNAVSGTVTLSASAVLTPLARDVARTRNIKIVRQDKC